MLHVVDVFDDEMKKKNKRCGKTDLRRPKTSFNWKCASDKQEHKWFSMEDFVEKTPKRPQNKARPWKTVQLVKTVWWDHQKSLDPFSSHYVSSHYISFVNNLWFFLENVKEIGIDSFL